MEGVEAFWSEKPPNLPIFLLFRSIKKKISINLS